MRLLTNDLGNQHLLRRRVSWRAGFSRLTAALDIEIFRCKRCPSDAATKGKRHSQLPSRNATPFDL
jgi:hypothetical protein